MRIKKLIRVARGVCERLPRMQLSKKYPSAESNQRSFGNQTPEASFPGKIRQKPIINTTSI